MKVIDLLNKIANGEEVPKRIKYINSIWEYDEKTKDYFHDDLWLIYSMNSIGLTKREVEIIEDTPKEDKKIEKLRAYEEPFLKNGKVDTRFLLIIDQLNEIIDKINGEENEKNNDTNNL